MAKRIGAPQSGAKRGESQLAPDSGDLIWLSFNPQAGREQAGRRPALILSPRAYNAKVGLCLACPVTQHSKGYAFEVPLPPGLPVQGVVLADHIKSADWHVRGGDRIASAPQELLEEVRAKLRPLFGL